MAADAALLPFVSDNIRLSTTDRVLVAAGTAASIYSAHKTSQLVEVTTELRAVQEKALREMEATKDANDLTDRVYRWTMAVAKQHYASPELRALESQPYLESLNSVSPRDLVEVTAKDRFHEASEMLRNWQRAADPGRMCLLRWAISSAPAEIQGLLQEAAVNRVISTLNAEALFAALPSRRAAAFVAGSLLGLGVYLFTIALLAPREWIIWAPIAIVLCVPLRWLLVRRHASAEMAEAIAFVEEKRGSIASYCDSKMRDPSELEREANEKVQKLNWALSELLGRSEKWQECVEQSSAAELLESFAVPAQRYWKRRYWALSGGAIASVALIILAWNARGPLTAMLDLRGVEEMSHAEFVERYGSLRRAQLYQTSVLALRKRWEVVEGAATALGVETGKPKSELSFTMLSSVWDSVRTAVGAKMRTLVSRTDAKATELSRWPLDAVEHAIGEYHTSRREVEIFISQWGEEVSVETLRLAHTRLGKAMDERLREAAVAAGMNAQQIEAAVKADRSQFDKGAGFVAALKAQREQQHRLATQAQRDEDLRRRAASQREASKRQEQARAEQSANVASQKEALKAEREMLRLRRDFVEAWLFRRLAQASNGGAKPDVTTFYHSLAGESKAAELPTALGFSQIQFAQFLKGAADANISDTGKVTLRTANMNRLVKAATDRDFLKLAIYREREGVPATAAEMVKFLEENSRLLPRIESMSFDIYHPEGWNAQVAALHRRMQIFIKDVARDRGEVASIERTELIRNAARNWPEVKKLEKRYPARFSLEKEIAAVTTSAK